MFIIADLVTLTKGLGSTIIYFQNRRSRITLPENLLPDHYIRTLDLGDYAEVAVLPTDDNGLPVTDGKRSMYLQEVNGDHTATIHVESGISLNIEFEAQTILSFSISVYEVKYQVRPSKECMFPLPHPLKH